MLKKAIELSNANLVKNADGLLSKRSSDSGIERIGPNENCCKI